MASQVVFDLCQAHRRINRHRHAAGDEHAEEAEQIVAAGRQHDRGRLAWLQTGVLKPRGHVFRALQKLAVRHRLLLATVVKQVDVGALRLMPGMPLEHLNQRLGILWRSACFLERDGCFDGDCARASVRTATTQQPQQVARGLDAGEDLFGQRHAEAVFDAGQQLDAAQAIETEVTLEPAVEGDPDELALARPQVLRELPHEL